MRFAEWIKPIEDAVREELDRTGNNDGSHGFDHFQRVSSLSTRFTADENGNELIAYAAGMLHDIVNLPKNHPEISKGSYYASVRASEILAELGFPKELIPAVAHAIHAHSYSAKVPPETIEAKCVQDADRMEALGAFGLMRTFYCSGIFGSELMHEEDPMGKSRELNDKKYSLDHFPCKLLKLSSTMQTEVGRRMAGNLSKFLEDFRNDMIQKTPGCFIIAETYQKAGSNNIFMFDPHDPFATNRGHQTEKYALDALLNVEDTYVIKFLGQLKSELMPFGPCFPTP